MRAAGTMYANGSDFNNWFWPVHFRYVSTRPLALGALCCCRFYCCWLRLAHMSIVCSLQLPSFFGTFPANAQWLLVVAFGHIFNTMPFNHTVFGWLLCGPEQNGWHTTFPLSYRVGAISLAATTNSITMVNATWEHKTSIQNECTNWMCTIYLHSHSVL